MGRCLHPSFTSGLSLRVEDILSSRWINSALGWRAPADEVQHMERSRATKSRARRLGLDGRLGVVETRSRGERVQFDSGVPVASVTLVIPSHSIV